VSDISALQSSLKSRIGSRSIGLKLLVVCALALVMMIPALFVYSLVEERTQRAKDATTEVGGLVGGQQTFLGPTLAIPYSAPPIKDEDKPAHGVYLVFPAQGEAAVKTRTAERRRSLFKVPVYQADLRFDAAFDLTGVPATAPQGAVLDWSRAQILVGVKDAHGALADCTMTVNGKTDTFVPTDNAANLSFDSAPNHRQFFTLFGVAAAKLAQPDTKFEVTANLRFAGAQRIAILAYGKTTHVHIEGDWPDPSFDGGLLPVNRSVSSQGFSGEWFVPFIARGVPSEGTMSSVYHLADTALGVSFVEMADPYQSVNRSLKYALLFVGLLFLSYFVFEVTTGKRVHPAQYVLVGMTQIIFYLLLLSFAERFGFDLGFLVAGAATVILLSANAGWIFASRVQGLRALVCFSLLYALIYLLLRLEDNALLVGAVASFLAVAAAMYFTRKIDWYSSMAPAQQAQEPKPAVAKEGTGTAAE